MEARSCQHARTFPLSLVVGLLLTPTLCEAVIPKGAALVAQADTDASPNILRSIIKTVFLPFLLPHRFSIHTWLSWTLKGMVLTAVCGLGSALWLHRKRKSLQKSNTSIHEATGPYGANDDVVVSDPGLLKKHSTIRSYTVASSGFTYPAIRTFYRPHPHGDKLPTKPSPIPLFVFIHGLGGSIAQFHPILVSLVNLAPCLAIDLPGCGLSSFAPQSWDAYTTESLVRLLAEAIEAHRDRDGGQGVILIGHSMGCSLAALLASSTSPSRDLISRHVQGVVAICPKAEPLSRETTHSLQMRMFRSIPGPIFDPAFDLIRRWDRRGGANSKSVLRMAGPNADDATRRLQLRFNLQSRTPVWRRMVCGMIPDYSTGYPRGGFPGREVWSGLDLPVFLAAGQSDLVTPPENIQQIIHFLGKAPAPNQVDTQENEVPVSAAPIDPERLNHPLPERQHQDSGVGASDLPKARDGTIEISSSDSDGSDTMILDEKQDDASVSTTSNNPEPIPRRLVVKYRILPDPASHTLPFATTSSRILAGLIGDFLSSHVDPRLSLGWQLQYLSTEGKWEVKNLAKWKAVQPVSLPIGGVFRALKTLREVDEYHCPPNFVKEWAGKIRVVVDISHESPVYDPKGLEAGGIAYRKFPIVSKLPPSAEEVSAFIALIDKTRTEFDLTARDAPLIGVHCHYGFNRTGYFLVCYLVERLHYRLEDAIEEFAKARPPGIRHQHFIDALHVRYCVGLKRAPTL